MTWADIQEALATTPGSIVAPWTFPPSLELYTQPLQPDNAILREASDIFIQLTQTWWALLADSVKRNPNRQENPQTLEQATAFWSLSHLWDTINLVQILPRQRGRDEGFKDQLHLWFRPADDKRKLQGKWAWFLSSYLTKYRTAVTRLSKIPRSDTAQTASEVHPEVHLLDKSLEGILARIQCFPAADSRTPCQSDATTGAVQLLLNPAALIVRGRAGGRTKRIAPPPMNEKDRFLEHLVTADVPLADPVSKKRAVQQYKRDTKAFSAQQKAGNTWRRGRGGRTGLPGRPRKSVVIQVDEEEEEEEEEKDREEEQDGSESSDDDDDDDEFELRSGEESDEY